MIREGKWTPPKMDELTDDQIERLLVIHAQMAEALRRIADHEIRADRRKRGMIDASEVEDMRRVARAALALADKVMTRGR